MSFRLMISAYLNFFFPPLVQFYPFHLHFNTSRYPPSTIGSPSLYRSNPSTLPSPPVRLCFFLEQDFEYTCQPSLQWSHIKNWANLKTLFIIWQLSILSYFISVLIWAAQPPKDLTLAYGGLISQQAQQKGQEKLQKKEQTDQPTHIGIYVSYK